MPTLYGKAEGRVPILRFWPSLRIGSRNPPTAMDCRPITHLDARLLKDVSTEAGGAEKDIPEWGRFALAICSILGRVAFFFLDRRFDLGPQSVRRFHHRKQLA